MSMFVVPEPLFDRNMAVTAYWLRCNNGKKLLGLRDDFTRMDSAFTHPGLELVQPIGIDSLTGGTPLFVYLTKPQLMTGVPKNIRLPASLLVCVIPIDCAAEPAILQAAKDLAAAGYSLALNGLPGAEHGPIMELVEYVCTDAKSYFSRYEASSAMIGKKEMVVYGVADMDAFHKINERENTYCAGRFYNQPVTKKHSKLSPVKVNALNLLNQVNREDFELEDIIRTIERDPYLTISLLKFINSGMALRNRQIESIQQAVAILGQDAVRRWATISLSTTLGEDRPSEITKQALVRAKFAEGVAGTFEMGVFQSSLFMAGLFSLLDVMLDKPMDQAITEVSVNDLIRQALVEHDGPLYAVLDLIYAYERADWDKVGILMIQHNTDMEHISKTYLDALAWYRDLLKNIETVPAT